MFIFFFLAATALLLCFVKPCIVLDFSNVFKKETNVLSLLTIFKNCLWFTLGNIFTSFSAVYTRYSSVNICSILQAYIFRTFKIFFKMKCSRDSDIPTVLQCYESIIRYFFLTLRTFAVSVIVTVRQKFAAFWWTLCQSFFLYLWTFTRYLIRPIKVPNSVKIYIA